MRRSSTNLTADFSVFAWPVVRHADGSTTEQPVPMAFARIEGFLARLGKLGFGRVRYGTDTVSMQERVRKAMVRGQHLLEVRNQFKRSDRRWNEAHTPFSELCWTLQCEIRTAASQIDDKVIRSLMAVGEMPAVKTVEQLLDERIKAKWRHGQAIAALRGAETEARRLARYPADIDEELRGMAAGLVVVDSQVNQQRVEG